MSAATEERVFGHIRDCIIGAGSAPTIQQAADQLCIPNVQVRSTVDALIRQGRLRKTKAKTRNLELAGVTDLRALTIEQLRGELARRGVTLDALAEPRSLGDRQCAANFCISTVRPGMLMCRPHWFALSKAIRDTIMASWAARDIQAYRKAIEAARQWIDDGSSAARKRA